MKRPLSIWIAQFIIGGMVLLYGFIFLGGLTGPQGRPIIRYFLGMAFLLALVSIWGIAFLGLIKKRTWGRWLGLVSLIIIWVILTYTQIYPTDGPYKHYEYSNDIQRAAASSTQVVIQMLFILLILFVAFSKKVAHYFQNQIDDQAGST